MHLKMWNQSSFLSSIWLHTTTSPSWQRVKCWEMAATHTDTCWLLWSFVSRNCLSATCGFNVSCQYIANYGTNKFDLLKYLPVPCLRLQKMIGSNSTAFLYKQGYQGTWEYSNMSEFMKPRNVAWISASSQFLCCPLLQTHLPHLGRDNNLSFTYN